MLQIEQFEKDQVWMITNGPKRAAKVLEVKSVMITRPGEAGQPPIKEARTSVRVQVCSPARAIEGHVGSDEATAVMSYRKSCMQIFGYDMWEEVWIDEPRPKYHPNPRIKQDGQWEYIVRVYDVIGRHGRHEGKYKTGRITGSQVDGILLTEDQVPSGLFDSLGADAKTQKQLDDALLKAELREEILREMATEKQEVRQGDCAEYPQWGPVSKLKSQAKVCGIQAEDLKDGKFNDKLRHLIAEYLRGISINPWDVFDMKPAEFKEAVEAARQKIII